MTTVSIDLNSDLGEGFGPGPSATTTPCSSVVTSANVACGFHAGDPDILRRVCGLAAERGVVIGAQVGYRDLPGFGRRAIDIDPATLTDEVIYQIGALDGFARVAGTRVSYVKPHGALYNAVVHHEDAGRRRRRGGPAVRRVAAGAGPARLVAPRPGRRGRDCAPSPRRSPTAATPRRARWSRGRSRGRCCTTRSRWPSGW